MSVDLPGGRSSQGTNMRYSGILIGVFAVALASIAGSLLPGISKQHKASSEARRPADNPVKVPPSQNFYYLLMFASQNGSNQVRFAHTFAAFVKGRGPAPDSAKCEIAEIHTISWVPQTLDVVLLRRRPEPGTNLNLKDSMRWARSVGAMVSLWGPYQVQKEFYDRAVEQETRLNSGGVQYKAIDEELRPALASNCIHAVCDIDTEGGLLHVGRLWGKPASRLVLNHFRRRILDSQKTYPWLSERMELTNVQVQEPSVWQ
jgi:hypothetical protein